MQSVRTCSRALALAGASVFALVAASAARAQSASCPTPTSTGDATCTIGSNDGVSEASVSFTGADGDGDNDASAGGTYTLINQRAITTYGQQSNVLFLRLDGGHGDDDHATRGGDGGTVTLNNEAEIQFYGQAPTSGGIGDAPGVWDDSGFVAAVYVAGVGGAGGSRPAGVGGGSGGNGGRSGEVTLNNSAEVAMGMSMPYGGAALFASAIAGAGGAQDSTVGDQYGGDAGDGRFVTITNSAIVDVSGSGGRFVWGIGAEGIGGVGGTDNGVGGEGPLTTVTSTGAVTVDVTGSDGFPLGVRGIYASSVGGPGRTSEDGSDYGGRGEEGKQVIVTVGADVSVTSADVAEPDDAYVPSTLNASTDNRSPANNPQYLGQLQQSGGVVSFSKGGDGGAGPQSAGSGKAGGTGAAAGTQGTGSSISAGESVLTVQDGAKITTVGDYLPGLFSLSAGGLGGAGREDSDGANGGFGGSLEVVLLDGASVETNGTQSHGIVGRSVGGWGGEYLPSSGFVDFSPNYAGSGASGGTADINIGVVYDFGWERNVKGSVTTHGTESTGILMQSFGGQGGATGDSFQLLGQSQPSTGYGGAGGGIGPVTWVDIATDGDYSRGMVLQSVGGGGGTGGSTSGGVVVGGAGGVGANGGGIDLSHAGDITTKGLSATALLGQSIGGGGGAAGRTAGVATVGGQAGVGGTGGTVGIYAASGVMTTSGDYAYGIVAQSVGGGGGDGGDAFSISAGAVPATAVGGDGGAAGGGSSTVVSDIPREDYPGFADLSALSVTTHGANAHAVIAQAVGGGGGTGGDADGGGVTLASMQMAGGGNSGGTGGTARVTFDTASVTTTGSHAMGVLAQSVGGGGGSGGSAFSFSVDAGFSLSVGVGGAGGSGGAANTATVSLTGTTVTTGSDSGTDAHGIVAQSVGGGGGNGGSSVARAIAKAVEIPDNDVSLGFAAAAAVGGKGGSGGNGAKAEADLAGSGVTTYGDGAMGVIAQSVGGGGGLGGSASSSAGVLGGEDSISATLSFAAGASGGSGGTGGQIALTMDGTSTVETSGDHANAVLLQSVGGGGGNAGGGSASTSHVPDGYTLNATFSLGAPGGMGQTGGAVGGSVDIGAKITTHGSGSRGLLAQSVGGGGGTAQGGTFGVAGNGDDTTVNLSVGLGRNGAGGGTGGAVSLDMYGAVTTSGGDADGVMLQSIGGGGGLAGSAASDAGSDDGDDFGGDDEDTDYRFSLAIGGTGGTGANAGTVTYTHGGQVTTTGDWADGVVVQSIGGGGGSGGTATAAGSDGEADYINFAVGGSGGSGGTGGAITVDFDDDHNAQINTSGYAAHGFIAQSIGGGGGQGGDGSDKGSGTLHLGGNGSSGPSEDGGDVTITDFINLSTRGDDAHGLIAQSIGGGGGIAMAGSASASNDATSHAVAFRLGGATLSGGGSADGGTVSVTLGTNLDTYGARAFGIVAQSIGGGGGIGAAGPAGGITGVSLGGGVGTGGTVGVHLTSNYVTTRGTGAHGIVAQSIGGGGGIAGDISGAALDTVSGFGTVAGGGWGGDVTVTLDGKVTTGGTRAHGVIAQSVGNGGGLGGWAGGTLAGSVGISGSGAGTVTVTANRGVSATGADAYGIFAQSQGTDENGVVVVTANAAVTGGSGAGAGVMIADGGSNGNTLTVTGNGQVSAASGVAVLYQGDTDDSYSGLDVVVESGGVVSGDINGYYANGSSIAGGAFTAMAPMATSAAFVPGPRAAVTVRNRAGGLLTGAGSYLATVRNAGELVVGDAGSTDRLGIAGDFVQSAGGRTLATVHFAEGAADLVTVEGAVSLAGTLALDPISVRRGVALAVFEGVGEARFDSAESGLFSYDQTVADGVLSVTAAEADFAADAFGLDGGQRGIARYLEAVYAGDDGGDFATLFGDLDQAASRDAGDYAAALSRLAPGATLAAPAASFALSDRRLAAVLACPEPTDQTVTRERYCAGLYGTAAWIDQDAEGAAFGYDGHVYSAGLAGRAEVAPGWFLGGALGTERGDFDGQDGSGSAEGDSVVAGLGLSRDIGALTLAAALSVSSGDYDTRRTVSLGGASTEARGTQRVTSVAGRLRAAYTRPLQGALYLRPALSLDVIHAAADSYTETGAGALDLDVDGSDETAYRAIPEIEVGGAFPVAGGVLRAYAGLGAAFLSSDSYAATARFADAGSGAGDFQSEVALADRYGQLSAGVEFTGDERYSLRADYDGGFGGGLDNHTLSLWAGIRF